MSVLRPLYHPFFFSFAYGSSSIVSLTGVFINLLSLKLCGYSKITLYMLVMDVLMLVISIIALVVPPTRLIWIVLAVLYSFYLMVFSFYGSFRSYPMLKNKKNFIWTIIGNIFMFLSFLTFDMGVVGIIPIYTWVFITMIPFPFAIVLFFFTKLQSIIKSNPSYKSNHKQKHLIAIFKSVVALTIGVSVPCISLIIVAGFLANDILIEAGKVLVPIIKIGFTTVNFLMLLNKSLTDISNPSGLTVFQTDKMLTSTEHQGFLMTDLRSRKY